MSTAKRGESNIGWMDLSPGQEAIWLHLPFVHPATYQLANYGHLGVAPDEAILRRAIAQVMARHDALRLEIDPSAPRQRVRAALPAPLRIIDLPAGAEADMPHEAFLRATMLTPFDLTRPPYFEFILVRVAGQGAWWAMRFHHLISDAVGVVASGLDIAACYARLLAGARPEAATPVGSFASFAAGELAHRDSAEGAEDVTWWAERIGAAPQAIFASRGSRDPIAAGWSSDIPRLTISADDYRGFRALCQQNGILPVQAWIGMAGLVGAAISGQPAPVVGVPMRNRTVGSHQTVGMCNGIAVLPVDMTTSITLPDLGKLAGSDLMEAYPRQRVSIVALAGKLGLSATRDQRLYDILVSYIPAGMMHRQQNAFGTTTYAHLVLAPDPNPVSLYILEGTGKTETTEVVISFNPNFLDRGEAVRLGEGLERIFATFMADPQTPLASYRPFREAGGASIGLRPVMPLRVRVSASFTADPITDGLQFWADRFALPVAVELAGYNQLFQELLDPQSGTRSNAGGVNLLVLRIEDWLRDRADAAGAAELIESTASDFVDALGLAARSTSAVHLLVLAPPSSAWDAGGAWHACQIGVEALLRQGVRKLSNVHLLTYQESRRLYPVEAEADTLTDRLGHVPYTHAQYIALATQAMRRLHQLRRQPVKVIAVDCDNTLWRGVVGEDGVDGLVLEASHMRLQQLLVEASAAGALICMVSKNIESDVLSVFERRPDMVLRVEHITAHRVNWESKSQNVRSIASELSLGLDSFVFLDDNPVEIAEVSANCPGAQCVAIPAEEAGRVRFIDHLWALDVGTATAEDRKRTEMYRVDRRREHLRSNSLDYSSFIADLGLKIRIEAPGEQHLPRLAQLTERTNQFNINGVRRDEATIARLLTEPQAVVRAVFVADRFGDYGLVGLLIAHGTDGTLDVDTLLMSCRVLGRGVEYALVAELGRIAGSVGCTRIGLTVRAAPRNLPVRRFLDRLPFERSGGADEYHLTLDSTVAAATVFRSESCEPVAAPADPQPEKEIKRSPDGVGPAAAVWTAAAGSLSNVGAIEAAMARPHLASATAEGSSRAPATATERAIAAIWQDVLSRESVGLDENFFAIGGTSLRCIQMMSRVHAALGVELPMRAVFAGPTVANLAALVESGGSPEVVHPHEFWEAETVLPADIRLAGTPEPLASVSDILLTGATGFLGAFLTAELLRRTRSRLHCVIRAPDIAEAMRRLQDNLRFYEAWDDAFAGRIVPVLGDLGTPRLGMDEATYLALSKTVGAVVHNGAQVNFAYTYETLKTANVGGTLEILRFAGEGRPKALHYVSSSAILSLEDAGGSGVLTEAVVPDHPDRLWNGYAQSKWVAEKLVLAAFARGLRGGAYRLGTIAGHAETGVFQDHDFVFRVVRACIAAGAAPDIEDLMPMVPVDFVARALVGIALADRSAEARVFHIDDHAPMSVRTMFAALRSFGYNLALLDFESWRQAILEASERDAEAVAPDVVLALRRVEDLDRIRRTRQLRVDTSRALAALATRDIGPSTVGETQIHRYLRFFVSTGFLAAPDKAGRPPLLSDLSGTM